VASYLGFETLQFSGSLRVDALFLGALCPSKSGLMNKHIVKHIGEGFHLGIVKHIVERGCKKFAFGSQVLSLIAH